jgi:hypothetical protein
MSNPNFKTSICKYAHIGCKQVKNCWYAHNKLELRQRNCINGSKCYDKNCCFIHPNQVIDQDEYYLKILSKSEVLGLDKDKIKEQLELFLNKIIIEFDNEDLDNLDDEDEDIFIKMNKLKINDDVELENFINETTNGWNTEPSKFYIKNEQIKTLNLNIKANELQIEKLMKYMKMMNIEFEEN